MYIQEVIIDGFKSYAQKTVVSGFDPQFNAITGLNGTGKSNILDAICFVLGISNLSQVQIKFTFLFSPDKKNLFFAGACGKSPGAGLQARCCWCHESHGYYYIQQQRCCWKSGRL
jgi:hypothetical protein